MTFYCVETENKHRYCGRVEPQIRVQIREVATNTCRVKLIPYSQRQKIWRLKKDNAYFVKVIFNIVQLTLF